MSEDDEPERRQKKQKTVKAEPMQTAFPCREKTGAAHWSGSCLRCDAGPKGKCRQPNG